MPDLIAASLEIAFTGTPLFTDVSLTVDPGDRIALVGPNGAGKTTLLRILSRRITATAGEVIIPPHVRVALHDQRPERTQQLLRDFVAPPHMVELEAQLRQLEVDMATGDPGTLKQYTKVRDRYDAGGGEGWTVRVDEVVRGLGFEERQLSQPLDTLSGGELTRASLARALSGDPDVLLLDEPTNHLDMHAIDWLQDFLANHRGGLVLVSHDRWFIEETCTSVLEVSHGRSRMFRGSFVQYRTQQALEAVTHQKQVEKWQEEVARLQRFVDKFSAGTRSKQAQSRVKMIERLRNDTPEYADLRERRGLGFKLPKIERPGAVVLEARQLHLGFDGDDTHEPRTLLPPTDFSIERGEKVALLGRNGTGKSTLLHALAAACVPHTKPPTGLRESGEIRVGYGVTARLLSQHDSELREDFSLLANMNLVAPAIATRDAMRLLGLFGFEARSDAERLVKTLSGGERRRLMLAMALTGSANVLLLDEPTNHLDIESREGLEAALAEYEGTVLLISHDRALVEGVANRTLVLHEQRLTDVVGGYEVAKAVLNGEAEAPPTAAEALARGGSRRRDVGGGRPAGAAAPKGKPAPTNEQRRTVSRARGPVASSAGSTDTPAAAAPAKAKGRRRDGGKGAQRVRRPATIEREIEQYEQELAQVQQLMLDPDVYTSPDKSSEALDRHGRLERDIAARYTELETALEHHS